MKISSQKSFFKRTIKGKACGSIEFYAQTDDKLLSVAGAIVGDYDAISDFNGENLKKAMEVLFDEKCRKDSDSAEEGVYRS